MDWLKQVASAYQEKEEFVLDDDADLGVDPRKDTLIQMGIKAKLSVREWMAVFISVGIAGIGGWLLVAAVLDPEPFSKLAATIGAGAILLSTGGFLAIQMLASIKPPVIRISRTGVFEIRWH